MDGLLELRPIRLFSFYLAVVFLCSTTLRWRQYRTILALVTRLQSKWPNLTKLVLAHRHIFLTWGTLRPLFIVLCLLTANTLAGRLIWPQADSFTLARLLTVWPAVPVVAVTGLCMVVFDIVGTLRVGKLDQAETEKYFELAESWLRGWKAPVVRVLSLGFVNPRQIVAKEVSNALEQGAKLLHTTMWWVSIQTTLRIVFGLALWTTFALEGVLRAAVGAG
jgi:hypothetical protein